jgi:hypothetical protein
MENQFYTVVGGQKEDRILKYSSKFSILLLNRGGKFYRDDFLDDISSLDFAEILCMDGPGTSYDFDVRTKKYPRVKFLLLKDEMTIGEKINLGINEARARFILVIWSDMKIHNSLNLNRIVQKTETDNTICMVPLLKTRKMEQIPSMHLPIIVKRKFKVMPWNMIKDSMKSLYPFDYCGIYNKEKFTLLKGFDSKINNPYWQKLDFGFRSYMWGEKITGNTSFLISYINDEIFENNTPDASYKLFYLKNIAVKYKKSKGRLPLLRYFKYMLSSDTGPISSLKEFLLTRDWVKGNANRFKMDSRSVISTWQIPE